MMHRIFRKKYTSLKKQFHNLISRELYKSKKSPLFTQGLLSLIIILINKIITFVSTILLVRFLGKSEYGIFSYFLSLYLILIVPAEHGVGNLIIRETAQANSKNCPDVINGVWRWSAKILAYFSLIFMAISVLVNLFGNNIISNNTFIFLVLGAVLVPCQSYVHLLSASLRGLNKVVAGLIPNLIMIPILFLLFFIINNYILPLNQTAISAMAAQTLSTIITLITGLVFFYKTTPQIILRSNPVFLKSEWASSSFQLFLSGGLNIIKDYSSLLIMGIFVNPGQIGSFQIAFSTAAFASVLLKSINMLLAPQFASLYELGEKDKLQNLITTSARSVFFVNILITLIFIFFGKSLIEWAFGNEAIDAYPVLLILLIGQTINSFMGSVVLLLNMTGFEKDVMRTVIISTIINTFIVFTLTPLWGILGTAIAISISILFAQVTMFIYVKKRLGIISSAFGKIN